MGYYTGSGVVISRRVTPVIHGTETYPTYLLDGVPQGWYSVTYKGKVTETVTRKAGIQDPGSSYTGNAAITLQGSYNKPIEKTFRSGAVSRMGDSNLFEEIITERDTTVE